MICFQALWKTKSFVKVCLKFKLPLWTKGLLIHLSPQWQLPLWHFHGGIISLCRGDLFGKDCIIANLVEQINKLRYKDGKGSPKGFKTFLADNNLQKGLIPRCRGNYLHVLFHVCVKYHQYYNLLLDFFSTGSVTCGGHVGAYWRNETDF